jgi:acyl-coenzyme A thioesterase PaaI-like protein
MGRPQPEGFAFFNEIPWCNKLLSHRSTTIFTPSHRQQPDINGSVRSKDQLLRNSLSNPATVPHCIGFYQNPNLQDVSEKSPQIPSDQQRFLINQVTLLFDLQHGVNGFHGITHGGFMSVLLDEAMGNLLFMHNSVDSSLRSLGQSISLDIFSMTGLTAVTAALNVQYREPLSTPQVVAVTATLSRIEGRKLFVDGKIENQDGVVFATGQSEWKILSKRGKL